MPESQQMPSNVPVTAALTDVPFWHWAEHHLSTANASAHGGKADSCSGLDFPRCVLLGSIAWRIVVKTSTAAARISNVHKIRWKPGIPAELLIKRQIHPLKSKANFSNQARSACGCVIVRKSRTKKKFSR
jgi:hypothetical protein